MIDLSIIIVAYETRDLVLETIRRIETHRIELEAGRGIRSEVIVVDNGSRDGTADALRAFDGGVRLVAREANGGFAVGVNAGAARARGRILLLLNSDACPTPGALERCLDVLDERPEAGVVGPQLLHEDGRLQNSVHAIPTIAAECVPAAILGVFHPDRYASKRVRARGRLAEVEAVVGAALFVRRAAFDTLGGLCEDFFFYLEETDLCLRARRAGWHVLFVPDARFVHASGASSKRALPERARIEFLRSLACFMRRHRGPAAARLVLGLRGLRAALGLLVGWPLLVPSERGRARLGGRLVILRWLLAGEPDGWGLAPTNPGSPSVEAGSAVEERREGDARPGDAAEAASCQAAGASGSSGT